MQWKAEIPLVFDLFFLFFSGVLVQIIIKFKKKRERKETDKTDIPRFCSAERNGWKHEDFTSPFVDIIRFSSLKPPDTSAQGLQIMQFHYSQAVCSVPAEVLCKVTNSSSVREASYFIEKQRWYWLFSELNLIFFNGTIYSFKEMWPCSFFIKGFLMDKHSICFLLS